MKKLLYATDFSESSRQAFLYALHIAKAQGAEIIILHSFQEPIMRVGVSPEQIQQIQAQTLLEEKANYKKALEVLYQIAIDGGLTEIKKSSRLVQGHAIEAILSVAADEDVDLIVMGTKGETDAQDKLIGSVASEILESSEVPVLVVPSGAPFDGKIDRLGIATELTRSERKSLDWALQFGAHFHAQLYCVYVDTALVEQYLHRMDELKADYRHKPVEFHVIDGVNVATELQEFVESQRLDLLVMTLKKRNFLQQFFDYSIAEEMRMYQKTPILGLQD